jgi:hypothetical protein
VIGVVLAGLVAGCSLGGGSGGAGSAVTGWTAYPPSSSAVAAVVKRMAKGLVPAGSAQAKCKLTGLRARCDVATFLSTGGFGAAVPIDRVWFNLRRTGSGWSVQPDCTSTPQSLLCLQLRREVRHFNTAVGK